MAGNSPAMIFSRLLLLHATPADHGILGVPRQPFIGVSLALADARHHVIGGGTGNRGLATRMRLGQKACNQNELGHARLPPNSFVGLAAMLQVSARRHNSRQDYWAASRGGFSE